MRLYSSEHPGESSPKAPTPKPATSCARGWVAGLFGYYSSSRACAALVYSSWRAQGAYLIQASPDMHGRPWPQVQSEPSSVYICAQAARCTFYVICVQFIFAVCVRLITLGSLLRRLTSAFAYLLSGHVSMRCWDRFGKSISSNYFGLSEFRGVG